MYFIDEIPIQNMCNLASFIIKPMESGSSVCIKKIKRFLPRGQLITANGLNRLLLLETLRQ